MLKKPSRNSGVAKRAALHDQVEALTALVKLCLKQIRDLTAREAALRWFVQHDEHLDQQKYNEKLAEALASFDEQTQKVVREALALNKTAMLQRLLETHDSKPQ